jgi:hypothetical protein
MNANKRESAQDNKPLQSRNACAAGLQFFEQEREARRGVQFSAEAELVIGVSKLVHQNPGFSWERGSELTRGEPDGLLETTAV